MKTPPSRFTLHALVLISLLLSLIGAAVFVTPAHAAGFVVTKTADTADGICDADCSLREAIIAANAAAGDDTITVPAGTYTLTIVGTGEDAAATGDLDITSNITISGAGAGSTIIQAGTLGVGGPPNGIDRVFHVTGAFTVSISGVTVRNGNIAGDYGGGIFNENGTLTITNSTFSGNSAVNTGGGIFNAFGTLTITNSTFSGNSAVNTGGGGIYNWAGAATITNSAFSDNSTSGQGGGVYTSGSGGTLTVTNSTFSLNNASDAGGGILNQGGIAAIANSTFSGNSASGGGGGILSSGLAGTLDITNSTFSGNSAVGYGGGIRISAGTATLRNTIVANSTSGGNCSGPTSWIINSGNNIDDGTTCGWGSTNGSMSSTNPNLGALANNGGPTQTFALLTGSPAIDGVAFNPPNGAPSTDQRGVARPQGVRYDIGSYEVVAPTFADVPMSHWAWPYVEAIYSSGLTIGCGASPLIYCPDGLVTRAEMAVFIKKGIHGSSYTPPAPNGSSPFSDIAGHWAEGWMEELYDEGLTVGYPDGTYRPENQVTRGEMSVFLLKAKHGSSYVAPLPSGGSFSDVAGHWAERWIEQLWEEGITSGYPDGTFRPENNVTRAEMAVFLVRAFSLPLP